VHFTVNNDILHLKTQVRVRRSAQGALPPHGRGGAEAGLACCSEGAWLAPARLVPRKRQAARPANEVCERGV